MPYQPVGHRPFDVPNKHAIPGMHFRWLNSANREMYKRHLMHFGDRPGYQPVQGPTVEKTKELAEKLGLNASYVDLASNRIMYGECVLAMIPMGEQVKRRKDLVAKQVSRVKDVDAAYYDTMDRFRSKGITPFIRDADEIEDRANRAMGNRPFISLSTG